MIKKLDYDEYEKNINYLLNMAKKDRYDNETPIAIGFYKNKEVLTTEFLVAKQFGYLPKFQGHSELKEYFRLIPFVFANNLFDEVFKNLDNGREIYSFLYKQDYRMFHILDENNKLVSFFVNSPKNFSKQIDKKFKLIKPAREGGYFSILSPAEPFWRQADLMERLYQDLKQKSISQKDFIAFKNDTDKIDELYNLSDDDIKIIEKSEVKNR